MTTVLATCGDNGGRTRSGDACSRPVQGRTRCWAHDDLDGFASLCSDLDDTAWAICEAAEAGCYRYLGRSLYGYRGTVHVAAACTLTACCVFSGSHPMVVFFKLLTLVMTAWCAALAWTFFWRVKESHVILPMFTAFAGLAWQQGSAAGAWAAFVFMPLISWLTCMGAGTATGVAQCNSAVFDVYVLGVFVVVSINLSVFTLFVAFK